MLGGGGGAVRGPREAYTMERTNYGSALGTDALAGLLRTVSRCASIRPSVLLETAAFGMGAKPALRFTVDESDADALEHSCAKAGIPTASRRVYLEPLGGTWTQIVPHRTESYCILVVIGQTSRMSRELLKRELVDSEGAGRLLGYPPCCLAAFPRLAQAGATWPFVLLESALESRTAVDARCNRFAADWGGIGLIGELFPCSLYCRSAAAYSDRLRSAARAAGLQRLALQAESDALTPVEIYADGTISTASDGRGRRVEFRL